MYAHVCVVPSPCHTSVNVCMENGGLERPVMDSMIPLSSVLIGQCLYGAHILCEERLTSLVWPDLFALQAHMQLSSIH